MKIMLLLILISLVLAAGFLLVYLWAARSGQFDDEYTPSVRMLFDDPAPGAAAKVPEAAADQPSREKAIEANSGVL
jgi:cbb3-type cytochrome oxidase maturation protein